MAIGSLTTVVPSSVAEKISNPVAEFYGLDKITGRITSFDVYLDETVQFGTLRVTPRVCNSRPPTEEPNTVGFIEVDEVTLANDIKRIFTGWMFVASPALNAVEHGIYDVWLTDCKRVTSKPPPENYSGLPVEFIDLEKREIQEAATEAEEAEPSIETEPIVVPRPKPNLPVQ